MKSFIPLLLAPLSAFCAPFFEPHSGIQFDLPDAYHLEEQDSVTDCDCGRWFYTFEDEYKNEIILDVERYDSFRSLPEHFHKYVTIYEKGLDREEDLVLRDLQFDNEYIRGKEYTKCFLSLLALDQEHLEPVYIFDYLFVDKEFGFALTLLQKGREKAEPEVLDKMMRELIKSVEFNTVD